MGKSWTWWSLLEKFSSDRARLLWQDGDGYPISSYKSLLFFPRDGRALLTPENDSLRWKKAKLKIWSVRWQKLRWNEQWSTRIWQVMWENTLFLYSRWHSKVGWLRAGTTYETANNWETPERSSYRIHDGLKTKFYRHYKACEHARVRSLHQVNC